MDILLIRDGVVRASVSANDVAQAQAFYTEDLCMQDPSFTPIGSTYVNGVFTPPAVDPLTA